MEKREEIFQVEASAIEARYIESLRAIRSDATAYNEDIAISRARAARNKRDDELEAANKRFVNAWSSEQQK